MKSPKDMRIIQIDVTNACVHHCSNCTRFCGLHKKPYFMSFETFKRAVDSLDGYVGTIGIMGGEPTLNPEFERMARYLAGKRPPKQTDDMLRPQVHFMDAIHDMEMEHTFPYPCLGGVRQTVNGPGLWSSIGENYKKYYEVIQDTIQYQALNDHVNSMYHQPALVTRKALQIPDDQWFALRDRCWVQNMWSASVTPKGAFFCEVAGALDMLFDGPGGWAIEEGWWKKKPEDFGSQLQWCELCGLACDTFMRDANEEIYDVSRDMYEKLVEIESPLIGSDHINVLDIQDGKIPEENKAASQRFSESMPYTESYSARYNESRTNLMDKSFVGLIVCTHENETEAALKNLGLFSEAYVYADKHSIRTLKKNYRGDGKIQYCDSEEYTFGYVVYQALKQKNHNRYAMVLSGKVGLVHVFERMEKLVLNPGTLLYWNFTETTKNDYFSGESGSEVALINGVAHSISHNGWDIILHIENLQGLVKLWQPKKIIDFVPESERKASADAIVPGKRYAIYGAGGALKAAIEKIESNGAQVAVVVDGSDQKIGVDKFGFTVQSPDYLEKHKELFDKILLSGGLYYREVKERALQMGFKEEDLAWI